MTVGAARVLKAMIEHEFFLFGDPSREVPLFFLPSHHSRKVLGVVDLPQACFCAELLELGFIEPESAEVKSGDRRFRVSEAGFAALKSSRPP